VIVFELICAGQHRFEGWFASAEDFQTQRERGLLCCPVCADAHVEKLPTAKIKTAQVADRPTATENASPTTEQAFMHFVESLFNSSENVGKAFAEEARRIHYEEAPKRNIRGYATADENAALRDEGIPVVALPIPPREEMN
jgi:hypothetical protein